MTQTGPDDRPTAEVQVDVLAIDVDGNTILERDAPATSLSNSLAIPLLSGWKRTGGQPSLQESHGKLPKCTGTILQADCSLPWRWLPDQCRVSVAA